MDKPTANPMHVEPRGHSTVNHTFRVFTENARLHNDERLAEALAEVSSMQWDIIIFMTLLNLMMAFNPMYALVLEK